MLIAPLVPWYSVPIPLIVFLIWGLAAAPGLVQTAEPLGALWSFFVFEVLGLLLPITASLASLQVRKGAWEKALWCSFVYLGSGSTVLATFLMISGGGAVEPWGFVSPAALLVFAAIPAAYEIEGRWASERRDLAGGVADEQSRKRLRIVSVGFALVLAGVFTAFFTWAGAAIQGLPASHFYYEEQAIRERATMMFTMVALPCVAGFLLAVRVVLRRQPTASRRASLL